MTPAAKVTLLLTVLFLTSWTPQWTHQGLPCLLLIGSSSALQRGQMQLPRQQQWQRGSSGNGIITTSTLLLVLLLKEAKSSSCSSSSSSSSMCLIRL
jgi:hypothetical protein